MGSNEKTFAIIALCGIIGVIFAIILQILDGEGIDIVLFLTNNSLTLPQLQLIIIVLWEIFGIVLAAVTS
jgi:hypothetical protein